jgi:pimeloyl-ACP methyl ester carboxylesterase
MRRWVVSVSFALLCFVLGGCTLVKLRQEVREINGSTVLVGRITAPSGWDQPIVVAAYSESADGIGLAHCTMLHEAGGYELIVPNGNYKLFAFGDADCNLRFDPGEPAATFGSPPQTVAASGTGVVANLDLSLRGSSVPAPIPVGTQFSDCGIGNLHSTQAGAIANLDDPIFSADYGAKSYWSPLEFFREVGGNIYFLDPYDPAKIPVLFVHGAAGSPQDWRFFIEHLDRSRYQPWIFYYPSGARIDSMAHLLSWKLFNLQLNHQFDRIYIAAHSMGGLVVRSLLLDHGETVPAVKLFVSLSTPWGGDPAAELGVRNSPAVVPSWIDMQPEGKYMRSLFARRLPPGVDYYLLFGFKGGFSVMRPNNDGTVTLASELRPAAQSEAKQVFGFDEDHVGILSSQQVVAQFQAIADSAASENRKSAQSSGSVRVRFSLSGDNDGSATTPVLWLRPVDRRDDAIAIPMRSEDTPRDFGPIPHGDYEASLVVQSFKTVPSKQRLTVVAGQRSDLQFTLTAQGVLLRYVTARTNSTDLPAGGYLPPDRSIKIDSISLRGLGVERKLIPRPKEDSFEIDRYLAGEDDAVQGRFSFVNLPAGEYQLTVLAEGYQPYSESCTVSPGYPGPWRPILLEPAK